MRPDPELILACCRAALGTDSPRIIQDLVTGGLYWEHVLSTASRHSVIPLVYPALKSLSFEGVPLEAQKRLQDQFQENTQWSLYLTSELVSIITLLASQSFKVAALQRPGLERVALRQRRPAAFVDLDIFVRREDFSRINELLISQGYRPDLLLIDDQETLLLRTYYHQGFYHKTKGVLVELHWEISRFFLALPPYPQLVERLARSLLGTEILCFPPEDRSWFLLSTAPHVEPLAWVCDVAAAIGQPAESIGKSFETPDRREPGACSSEPRPGPGSSGTSLPPDVAKGCSRMRALNILVQGVQRDFSQDRITSPTLSRKPFSTLKLRETPAGENQPRASYPVFPIVC